MRYNDCPGCGIPIVADDKKFLMISEKPYRNIFWHKLCLDKATPKERKAAINGKQNIFGRRKRGTTKATR